MTGKRIIHRSTIRSELKETVDCCREILGFERGESCLLAKGKRSHGQDLWKDRGGERGHELEVEESDL
jgi:hypothetical protein